MSQVSNLRAMFENKGESTSPPDRGRTLSPSSTASDSRPLSTKVRANFIAIEKDGRVGLQRDTSHESSVSRKRLSNDTTEGTDTVATSVPEKLEPVPVLGEPIKSSPATTPSEPPAKPPAQSPTPAVLEPAPTSNGAATQKAAPKQATKPVEKVTEKPKPSPAPVPTPAPSTKENAPNRNAASAKVAPAVKKAPETAPKQEVKSTATTTTTARSNNLTVSKPSRSGTKSPAATSRATTPSPREPKAPNAASSSASATASKKPASTVTPKKSSTPAVSQKQTPSTSARKPPPIQMSPSTISGVGFVKPKPKSPTKPVNLPSSLTSHTASSGNKTGTGRLSAGSAGSTGSSQNVRTSARSSSRASASTASTLRRASSNISRSRPSIGPPPKKPVQEKPDTGKPKVDEGFLARMMRPTQSSQSKTADRAPVTPPRIAATQRRPATRQGDMNQRDGSRARGQSRTRRLTSRSVSPSRTASTKITREATPVPPITEEMAAAPKENPQNDAPATLEKPSEVTRPEPSTVEVVPEPQQTGGRKTEDTATSESPAEAPAVAVEPAKEDPVAADDPVKEDPVVADEPAKEDPVVADEPAKEDPVVANVTAEVADLKMSEPPEPVAAAIEAIPEDAPSETREADQTQTAATDEVKESPEASETHIQAVENEGATATDAVNDKSAESKAEDEQETW